MNSIKITVVGDGMVGKTYFISVFHRKAFPSDYIPTVLENIETEINVNGTTYPLVVWDTAGQEAYDRLRPLAYTNTKCFLVCYSVQKSIASFENVSVKWIPEVRHFNKNAPIILVGTKIDLRQSKFEECYTVEDGLELADKFNIPYYVECSALQNVGVDDVFEKAVIAYENCQLKKEKSRMRCIDSKNIDANAENDRLECLYCLFYPVK